MCTWPCRHARCASVTRKGWWPGSSPRRCGCHGTCPGPCYGCRSPAGASASSIYTTGYASGTPVAVQSDNAAWDVAITWSLLMWAGAPHPWPACESTSLTTAHLQAVANWVVLLPPHRWSRLMRVGGREWLVGLSRPLADARTVLRYAAPMRPLYTHCTPYMCPLCTLHTPSIHPPCAVYAPTVHAPCAHYAHSVHPPCALYTPSVPPQRHPLYILHASSIHPLYTLRAPFIHTPCALQTPTIHPSCAL